MTVKEYLSQLSAFKVDEKKVTKIEKIYGKTLPDTVKKMVSNNDKSLFIGDYRILSFSEIKDAEDDLEVNFSDIGIIPLVDCGDNDFIVYNFKTEKWSLFNIIDSCSFKVKSKLEELMK